MGDSETSSARNNGHYILGSAHTHTRSLPVGPPSDPVDSQVKLVLPVRILISPDLWLTSRKIESALSSMMRDTHGSQ